MTSWKSGKQFLVSDVCAHDKFEVRIRTTSVAERPVAGLTPHLVFVPEFGHNSPALVGGDVDRADPAQFRLNLAPTYFPFRGQLFLDGGVGNIEYTVSFKRTRCCSGPSKWALTLRDLDSAAAAVQIPHGVYAISAPRDVTLLLTQGGDALTLLLSAGQPFELDHHSLGTINSSAGVVEAVTCHVRL